MKVDEIDLAVGFWKNLVSHLVLEHDYSDDIEEKIYAADFSQLNKWHDEDHAKHNYTHPLYAGMPIND